MALAPGTILHNRYRIEGRLGRGGFGAIYKAYDLRVGRTVALKENLDTSREAERQFEREAEILGGLSHHHLADVFDRFVVPGQGQYLVMQYIAGIDLGQRLLRGKPLPEEDVLRWIMQIGRALMFLHDQNPPIIHRDVKPANIRILQESGGQDRAVLVDFGLAKVHDPGTRTTIGARAFSPGYSPPEQYSSTPTDARSDIYALGATVYHLITGRVPQESTVRLLDDALLPARRVNPAVSAATSAAVARAMALKPEQRFANVEAFLQALPVAPRPISRMGVSAPDGSQNRHTAPPRVPEERSEPAGVSARAGPAPSSGTATPAAPPAERSRRFGTDLRNTLRNRLPYFIGLTLVFLFVGAIILFELFSASPPAAATPTSPVAVGIPPGTVTSQTVTSLPSATSRPGSALPATFTPDQQPGLFPPTTAAPATTTPVPTPLPVTATPSVEPTWAAVRATADAIDALIIRESSGTLTTLGQSPPALSDAFVAPSDIQAANLYMRATFVNPASPPDWDYGFYFRAFGSRPDTHYRLYVDGNSRWRLDWFDGATASNVAGGVLSGDDFNTAPAADNRLTLLASGNRGWLLLNGQPSATFSLNERLEPGAAGIGTGLSRDRDPVTVAYSGFAARSLGP